MLSRHFELHGRQFEIRLKLCAIYRLTLVQRTLAPLTAAALHLAHQTAVTSGVRLGWLADTASDVASSADSRLVQFRDWTFIAPSVSALSSQRSGRTSLNK